MVGLSQELSKLKINNFQSIKKLILVSRYTSWKHIKIIIKKCESFKNIFNMETYKNCLL